ncbi:MAG: xanthine dehydrogenase family protein subunit M [Acidimicrobiia bacterium]
MIISEYHRPATLEEALALLARAGVKSAPLGGGTVLNGLPKDVPEAVVDLQSLGLDSISEKGETLMIGAMSTLDSLTKDDSVPHLLRELAHREAPNTIRNSATIGGTIGARDLESGLLAGLLAYDTQVTVLNQGGSSQIPLGDLLADPSHLDIAVITSVSVPMGGAGVYDSTARTPADIPIVLVAGHVSSSGTIRLAAAGVSETPIIVKPDQIEALDPQPDFRGSADYRRHLARVLSQRVTTRLEDRDSP